MGGLLDEDGVVIGTVRKDSASSDDNRDPKKPRSCEEAGGSSSNNPVVVDSAEGGATQVFSRVEVDKIIQEEIDKRMAAQLLVLEERAMAAAMAKI